MIDIFDFIDSKDIRDYNRQLGTMFTPIEQAVIIYNCDSVTVEEKLAAWHELLDAYNEEDFSKINLPDGGKVTNRDIMLGHTYRQMTEITVDGFEKALLLKNKTENVFYLTQIYAGENSTDCEESEFSSYDKAYEYLCNSKKRELLDYGEKLNLTMNYAMRVISLDESNNDMTEFIFDNDFRMTNIYFWTGRENYGLDMIYIYIPLPFKKGDIVHTIDGSNSYAIVPKTPDKNYFIHACDSTAMHITAFCLSERNGEIIDDFGHYNIFSLERCTEEDLPQDSYVFIRQRFLNLRNKL